MPVTDVPLVSVVISNYNYARFLPECLDSVLTQTYPNVETIVVDDGSTDHSRAVLVRYAGHITAILQPNSGQAAAINRGVAAARGDVICFLDCDDWWLPHKVERVIDIFRTHPRVEWMRHKARIADRNSQPLKQVIPLFAGSRTIGPDPTLFLERIITSQPSCVAIKRSLADRAFPIRVPPELAYDSDDAVMLASFFAAGATGYSLDEVLGFYRRHPGVRFGAHEIPRLIRREADVTQAMTSIFGIRSVPSAAYKLRTVLAGVNGAHLWHPERTTPFVKGIAATLRLRRHPRLMFRQAAALVFAFAAPGLWLRKLSRSHALHAVADES